MMDDAIFEYVKSVLKDQCFVKVPVTPDSRFQNDLGIDSVGAIALMTSLEMKYKINFDITMRPPSTVKELVEIVESLKA